MDTDAAAREEQRARLAWMINEFEEARRRRLVKPGGRLVKPGDGVVESGTEADTKEAPTKPSTSHS